MNVVDILWCEAGFKVDGKEGANTGKGCMGRNETGM